MSANPQIIFRNITNLNDARYAATVFAYAISFTIEPGLPNSIAVEKAKEICQWVSGPKKYLEINNLEIEDVLEGIAALGMDGIITSDSNLYDELSMRGLDVIWDAKQLIRETSWPQIIYNFKENFTENEFFQLENPDQVSIAFIVGSNIRGICISGTDEEVLGMKDYSSWNDFFDQLLYENN